MTNLYFQDNGKIGTANSRIQIKIKLFYNVVFLNGVSQRLLQADLELLIYSSLYDCVAKIC